MLPSSSSKSFCNKLSIKGRSGLDKVNEDWYTYSPTCSTKNDNWRMDPILRIVNMGRLSEPKEGCIVDSDNEKSNAS